MTGRIVDNMPDAEYHQHPALSSTQARKLLESPAKYRYTLDHPQARKDSFDLGTAVHTKVLGTGADVITYPPEHLTPSGAASTKAATIAWAEEQRATGVVVIAPNDARRVNAMAEAVLAHPEARQILENVAGREVSVFADVDGVPVRARFDIYDGTDAADLKTARDASPKGFNTSVGRYGYAIQEAWYAMCHAAVTGNELESFRFLVVESTAPYLVGVYDLDFMWEQIGREQTKRALDLYRQCTETGAWPGYGTATLTPPTWAVYESEDGEEIQV
jgi:exodeoxyribonuclease VIII